MKGNKRKNWMKYGAAGIGILAAVRVLFSLVLGLNYAQLAVFGFMLLVLLVFYCVGTLSFGGDIIKNIGKRMARYGSWREEDDPSTIAVIFLLIFVFRVIPITFPIAGLPSGQPGWYIRFLSRDFPLFGGPIGALISNTVCGFRMGRNMDEITDICRAYTYHPGNGSA